ncbi:hypothetical protein [Vibrio owensii]|uniref:hypothetical protein n=1 Tax=Vibrio harveyi group TaxID=717610 RepID=UPI003CC55904
MNIPSLISKIQNGLDSKAAVFFDWILGLATLSYGLYLISQDAHSFISWMVVGGGVLGLILAYIRPSTVANKLVAKAVKKPVS